MKRTMEEPKTILLKTLDGEELKLVEGFGWKPLEKNPEKNLKTT